MVWRRCGSASIAGRAGREPYRSLGRWIRPRRSPLGRPGRDRCRRDARRGPRDPPGAPGGARTTRRGGGRRAGAAATPGPPDLPRRPAGRSRDARGRCYRPGRHLAHALLVRQTAASRGRRARRAPRARRAGLRRHGLRSGRRPRSAARRPRASTVGALECGRRFGGRRRWRAGDPRDPSCDLGRAAAVLARRLTARRFEPHVAAFASADNVATRIERPSWRGADDHLAPDVHRHAAPHAGERADRSDRTAPPRPGVIAHPYAAPSDVHRDRHGHGHAAGTAPDGRRSDRNTRPAFGELAAWTIICRISVEPLPRTTLCSLNTVPLREELPDDIAQSVRDSDGLSSRSRTVIA